MRVDVDSTESQVNKSDTGSDRILPDPTKSDMGSDTVGIQSDSVTRISSDPSMGLVELGWDDRRGRKPLLQEAS